MGKKINHIGSQKWRRIVGEETFKSGPEERNEARSSTLPGKGQSFTAGGTNFTLFHWEKSSPLSSCNIFFCGYFHTNMAELSR